MIPKRRPAPGESSEYYTMYINRVTGDDFMTTLIEARQTTEEFLRNLDPHVWQYRYAEGKWSVKQVIIHVIDSERVFAYRALRFARNDQTPLPGFEQDDYVLNSNAAHRSAESVVEEYISVRKATIDLFGNFGEAMFSRTGTASNSTFTPLSLGYIIAGHEIHHLDIIRKKYLNLN